MNRFVIKSVFAFSTATLLLGSTALSALAVTAPQQQNQDQGQGQNGGGPGGPGGGGPGGGGGGRGGFGGGPGGFGGGPGGMMGNRTISAARLSLRLMASYLSLNDTQISKIAISRDDMQEASRMNPPARGGNGGGGNGANMQSMFAEMNAKRQSAERKAVAEIKAVLSTDQTAKLATLIKAMEALQTARIRPEAVGPLKLTDEQLTRIARGGAPDTILSPDQMAIVETFRIPAGGLGGPGGPGQGGPGGPDGQGGPPPPPDNSGA